VFTDFWAAKAQMGRTGLTTFPVSDGVEMRVGDNALIDDPDRWPINISIPAPHPVVEIKNVRLDLISGEVTRKVGHLQHVNDAARISVAPFDKLT